MGREGLRAFAVLAFSTALVGCATSRSEIIPVNPVSTIPAAVVTKDRIVFLRSVNDERVFEEAPKDPSTPSLGFEGAAKASADVKARAIGRKRNTFGSALGDILLEKSLTVAEMVQENVTAALMQAGYKVTTDAAATEPRPLVMDVHIKQCWQWFQPGFWALTLHTDITTDLEVSDLHDPVVVSVRARHSFQAATEDSWIEALDEGLKEFRTPITARSAEFPP